MIFDAIDLNDFTIRNNSEYLTNTFHAANGSFGIFGRVVSWKGIVEFVNAAAKVIVQRPDTCAFIVGDCSDGEKSYHDKVVSLINNYGLTDKIVLTGYRSDAPVLMGHMSIIVHASIRPEPFGMVIIEGMAMGKPIVATRAGGPMDIVVDGETGILVEPSDADAMASAILCLLNDPEKASIMGRQGRKRVMSIFSKERYAAQVEGVYAELLN